MLRFAGPIVLGVWLALFALGNDSAVSQTLTSSGVVQDVRVEGNQRIEVETIRSYMTIKLGDRFDSARMDGSLKSLFATGLFTDVTLRREGNTLVISVVENPIINRLAFEGNKRIDNETLEQEVQLRPRIVYTRTRVQIDVKRILELYRRSGRFAATVEPKVIALPQNRVDLVFEINEGEVTGIRRISFIGNRVFDDSDLRTVIQTTETRWWRILSSDDTYDPDRLTFDRELLRRHYLANGYADFRVVSAVAELEPEQDGFYVTFTIEEGERYTFGKIDINVELRNLDAEKLRPQMAIEEGDWYNADAVEETVNTFTDSVGSIGYAFVDVRPIVKRDRETKTIAITFDIQEGPKVFVERINIAGNTTTMDKVVRREFEVVEGDAFNTAKMRRSQQQIRNLGFFGNVEVTNVPGSSPDKTVINIDVEEKSTGQLSLGAGFSSDEGVIGDVGLRERNLLGRGQDLRLGFTISQRTQQIDTSFTEPYFLDRNLSAGFDLFRTERDFSDESAYDQQLTGFTLRSGYEILYPWSQTVKYGFEVDELTNVSSTASRFIREQDGTTVESFVGHDVLYDRRDNRFDPTDGYFVKFGNDIAGLGGNVAYLRSRVEGGTYFPLDEDFVLSITGESGYIVGLGQDIGIGNRYFLGGDKLRGFAVSGIGPRDSSTDDALGGNWFYAGTTELSFPIGLPKELGVLGKLFSDFGSAGSPDLSGDELLDEPSLRASLGIGLGWRSPFGPVRLDYSKAFLEEAFDKKESVRISFGTTF